MAVAWYAKRDEPWHAPALQARERIRTGEDLVFVPEQFFFEMLSVLCRKTDLSDAIEAILSELTDLVRARFSLDVELVRETVRIVADCGLSGYDAVYVALARRVGGVWLTADRRAHERVAPLGLSRLVG